MINYYNLLILSSIHGILLSFHLFLTRFLWKGYIAPLPFRFAMEKLISTPPEYDDAIRRAITTFEEMNQPRFKGYIKLTVRPHGKLLLVSEELYCMDKDARSHEKIFERFCALLNKAVKHFGVREFAFEITNMKGDSLLKIRFGTSRRVARVIQQLEKPEPAAEPEPVREEAAQPAPVPDATSVTQHVAAPAKRSRRKRNTVFIRERQPENDNQAGGDALEMLAAGGAVTAQAPEPQTVSGAGAEISTATESVPVEETPASNDENELVPCPNPDDPIDYKSMLYFPTEAAPGKLRRAFEVCGINTNRDLLQALGTLEPTREEWDGFFRRIQRKAAAGGVKLWDSCDGTLYWWLTKKMRWVRKFPTK
jgi:hypothetical protein